jgi:hypothetical protein
VYWLESASQKSENSKGLRGGAPNQGQNQRKNSKKSNQSVGPVKVDLMKNVFYAF